MPKHLESCLDEIANFRANMNMLQRAIDQDEQELIRLERTLPDPNHPDHAAHKARIDALAVRLENRRVLWSRVVPELEALLQQCRESEARVPAGEQDRTALEASLRKTIDDPRYWRDGDPGLSQFVSGGFKRLYPDD